MILENEKLPWERRLALSTAFEHFLVQKTPESYFEHLIQVPLVLDAPLMP